MPDVRTKVLAWTVTAVLGWTMAGGAGAQDQGGPLTPTEAQGQFQLDEGLRIELVAAEPLVRSPVDMAFDEDGRLWVVEMPDYPEGPLDGGPPQGRIVVLEDRDQDGRFERSSVFMESVLFATGVLPWRGGALVTGQFGILYMKDTDGDGAADLREPLYEGSYTEVSQHFLNSPTLGFDNWVYVANGLRMETVVAASGGSRPVDVRGLDFRFDPLGSRHEAATGLGQFGMSLDRWGRRFTVTNRNHVVPIGAPVRYLARNPHLTLPRQWDDQRAGGSARIHPLSKNWTTSILHAGTFTAACGITLYGGDLLDPRYRGSAFTADPTGNLVHEAILVPRGAGFGVGRSREGVEFLASPDPWFRPVNLANGPDGALYVVDMYLADIEHPIYVPEDRRDRMDLQGGRGLGRIWRIVPEDHRSGGPAPALGATPTDELPVSLESRSAWWRRTAHRLILERQDVAAVTPLESLVMGSDRPDARIHAAWLLQGLGAMSEPVVRQLLVDSHPRVREHGVRLAEWFLRVRPVRQQLLALADDPDPRVRYQLALTLGEIDDPAAVAALARIASQAPGDVWTRIAVSSAAGGRTLPLVEALFPRSPAREMEPLVRDLAALVGAEGAPRALSRTLDLFLSWDDPDAQAAALNGLAAGLGRGGRSLRTELTRLPGATPARATALRTLAETMTDVAADAAEPEVRRVEAVRLVGLLSWAKSRPVLEPLLAGDPSAQVSLAAVEALNGYESSEVAPLLLEGWRLYLPEVRRAVLLAVGDRPEARELLLSAVEEERILPGELTPVLIRSLEEDPILGERAQAVFLRDPSQGKGELLARYQPATEGEGVATQGRAIFEQNCAQCHRVAGVGVLAGPDIADTRTKSRDVLLRDILDPSAAIDAGYTNYIVETTEGETLTGFIASSSGASLTLTGSDGRDRVVPRSSIEEIRSQSISVMPEDFDAVITVDQMRDLIEFLKNWRFEEP